MNISGIIGKKVDQTQGFLEDGTRIPISSIAVLPNVVSQIKSKEKEGYNALQIGFDSKKKINKSMQGHIKRAGLKVIPRFLREIKVDETGEITLGQEIKAEEVLKPGDIIDITGTSKGKGFAGVVKRHHFKGGPRTHGQSDRERAPGSIGQSTTPGRVYKGKRMAGKMGNKQRTIKNLQVLDVVGENVFVKGLIPGPKGSLVFIRKVSQGKRSASLNRKFQPLFKKEVLKTETEKVEKEKEDVENAK